MAKALVPRTQLPCPPSPPSKKSKDKTKKMKRKGHLAHDLVYWNSKGLAKLGRKTLDILTNLFVYTLLIIWIRIPGLARQSVVYWRWKLQLKEKEEEDEEDFRRFRAEEKLQILHFEISQRTSPHRRLKRAAAFLCHVE